MSVKRKIDHATDEEAVRLWAAMTRVVALTPEGLEGTAVHVATLKLDGRRVCLSCKAGVCCRIDAVGRELLEKGKVQEDFVLDAEEHEGTFWAFDALMVRGRDIRSLSLADRLCYLALLLDDMPSLGDRRIQMKRYSSLRSADAIHSLLADSSSMESCDGLIFCDYTSIYETPAFKFKQNLTVDFCLESVPRGPMGTYTLLTQTAGRLMPFKLHKKNCELFVSAAERASLALATNVSREEGLILECAVPQGRLCKWKAVRLRPDRRSPNCLRTVLDTLTTHQKGYDEAAFIHMRIQPLATKRAFDTWLAILRRRILWDEECLGRKEATLEFHGSGHSGYDGSVSVEQTRLSLPLEGSIRVYVFFSLTEAEMQTFLSVLRLWLTGGGGRRSLRLVIALQLLHGGLSSSDARYFGTALESSSADLIGLAARSIGKTTLLALENASPPELLQLPPTLSQLVSGMHLLKAVAGEAYEALQLSAPHTP